MQFYRVTSPLIQVHFTHYTRGFDRFVVFSFHLSDESVFLPYLFLMLLFRATNIHAKFFFIGYSYALEIAYSFPRLISSLFSPSLGYKLF